MRRSHSLIRRSLPALLGIAGVVFSTIAFAEEPDTHEAARGTASLTIEQKNPFDKKTFGMWSLLQPTQEHLSGSDVVTNFDALPVGSYTIIVSPPAGTTTSIRAFHGREEVTSVKRPQLSFTLSKGEHLTVNIYHNFTRTGTVSVQSDPPGMAFELKGPNGIAERAVTPMSYEESPEGQYSVSYLPLEGCATPPPKSQQLKADSRASFTVTVECKTAQKMRSRSASKDDRYVVIKTNGEDVTLWDVPQDAWFSAYVFNAARRNVLGGYKDEDGKPNGQFGPENSVTVAELAKIAHRLGSVSEEAFIGKNPENPLALDAWFTPFIASAENRGWTLYKDATVDPTRPATRAEVVITFLQVLNIPLHWQTGQMFTDVTARTRYANAIETAAEDGLVSGRTDEHGQPLNLFDPDAPINRAEIAKMINNVFEIYKSDD